MKKILLWLILLLIPSIVSAKSKTSCDYTLLANMKKLASNVGTTYTYKVNNNYVYFDITLTNIQSDMYIIDNSDKKTYYYSDTVNGVLTLYDYGSGKVSYTIYSNNSECLNEKLAVKTVNLPYYNSFYNYPECEGIEEYKLCQKWIKYDGGYRNFLKSVTQYKEKLNSIQDNSVESSKSFFDKLIDFYLSYYYILIPFMVIIIVGILYLIRYIKFKINRFDV